MIFLPFTKIKLTRKKIISNLISSIALSSKTKVIDHYTEIFVVKQHNEYRNQYNFLKAEQ